MCTCFYIDIVFSNWVHSEMYLLYCMTHLAIYDMAKLVFKAVVQFYILLGSKMRVLFFPYPCYCIRPFVFVSVLRVLGYKSDIRKVPLSIQDHGDLYLRFLSKVLIVLVVIFSFVIRPVY